MNLTLARIDGQAGADLPIDDRGLCYGDGLFETVLVVHGRAVWWDQHLQRLARGAAVLGIDPPEPESWRRDLRDLLEQAPADMQDRCVLRMTLTRGSAGRGYASSPGGRPRRVCSLSAAPACEGQAEQGLSVRWCELRLATQPLLAGLKHLNRLEQVLARREWSDPDIDEGLLCDQQGAVVSAIAGNIAWLDEQGWHTPPIAVAGVEGVCRQQALDAGWFDVRPAEREQLEACRALLVCNSVRGILPVARIGQRSLPLIAEVRALQRALAELEPAFAYPFLTSN